MSRHLLGLLLLATADCGLASEPEQGAFDPLGLSAAVDHFRPAQPPAFSWKTTARTNNWKQGAYQIVVSGQDGGNFTNLDEASQADIVRRTIMEG